ncbi:MAG: hypothetical protein HYX93_01545 [Chloroflexi bacterium]|nr:hypothetical protein [Chloroflexota bacterium]
MPAATPQEAATLWEQNTASGVPKYRAKLTQMHQNYGAGLQRFWGVAPGPATTGAYQSRVNEQAAQRLGTNSQAGVQR